MKTELEYTTQIAALEQRLAILERKAREGTKEIDGMERLMKMGVTLVGFEPEEMIERRPGYCRYIFIEPSICEIRLLAIDGPIYPDAESVHVVVPWEDDYEAAGLLASCASEVEAVITTHGTLSHIHAVHALHDAIGRLGAEVPVKAADGVTIFRSMLGRTFDDVRAPVGGELHEFLVAGAVMFRFMHVQDCCENVTVEDITGDMDDLVGSPLTMAELVTNYEGPHLPGEYTESYTWSFYRFGTAKGDVTVRWLGESNGYYSETVGFVDVEKDDAIDKLVHS